MIRLRLQTETRNNNGFTTDVCRVTNAETGEELGHVRSATFRVLPPDFMPVLTLEILNVEADVTGLADLRPVAPTRASHEPRLFDVTTVDSPTLIHKRDPSANIED